MMLSNAYNETRSRACRPGRARRATIFCALTRPCCAYCGTEYEQNRTVSDPATATGARLRRRSSLHFTDLIRVQLLDDATGQQLHHRYIVRACAKRQPLCDTSAPVALSIASTFAWLDFEKRLSCSARCL